MGDAPELQMRDPRELKDHPRNRDFFDDLDGPIWDALVADVKANGVMNPIMITRDNVIISGHQRRRAALEAGVDQVPVRVIEFENEDACIERMICDNYLSRFGACNLAQLGKCARELERIWNVQDQRTMTTADSMSRKEFMKRLTEMTGCSQSKLTMAKNVAALDPALSSGVTTGALSAQVADRLFHKLSPLEQRVAGIALECGVFNKLTYKEIAQLIPDIKRYSEHLEKENKAKDDQINELREMLKDAEPGQFLSDADFDRMHRERDEAVAEARKYKEEVTVMKNKQRLASDVMRKRNKRIGVCTAAVSLAKSNLTKLLKEDLDHGMLKELKSGMQDVVRLAQQFEDRYGQVLEF